MSLTVDYVRGDATTVGTWIGVYGQAGYLRVAADSSVDALVPTGVTLSTVDSTYCWSPSTADTRATQVPGSPSTRIASTFYIFGTTTIDLRMPSESAMRVAIYQLDWDYAGRSQAVEAYHWPASASVPSSTLAASGPLRNSTALGAGAWDVFNVFEGARFSIQNGGVNSVVSMVCLDYFPLLLRRRLAQRAA